MLSCCSRENRPSAAGSGPVQRLLISKTRIGDGSTDSTAKVRWGCVHEAGRT